MKRLKVLCDERGQAMVFSLLAMTVLFGFIGFAVDVGVLLRAKRAMQTAADSAAIAAALEYNYVDMTTAAHDAAAQNGVVIGTNGGAVTVNTPPVYGSYVGKTGYVEAIVSQDQPTGFMGMISHLTSMTVTARAVATNVASNKCIDTLGTTGTDILMNGSVNLTATTCAITDNSKSSNALLANGSVTLNAQSIGVVGGVLQNGSVNINPNPVTGIAPESDPLAFLSPPANPGGCHSVVLNGSGPYAPLQPGCYSGIVINGSGSVTMDPGTYYMTGSLTVNGSPTVTGTGVTIYLAKNGASFTDNGSTTLNLSAPTSGDDNGILFYQSPADTSQLTINGSNSSKLQGIFYVPNATVVMNGSGSAKFYTAFVVNSLTFNGSGSLLDYASVNGGSPLTATRLVE